jgi:hypothetical protein
MSHSPAIADTETATTFRPASTSGLSSLISARVAWALATAAVIALRVAILFRYRIDSDETQHLHVAWGWSRGYLQYRDFFDNHMPLFQILTVPLVWLAGEHPDALILDRIAMLPLFALMALLAYRIGVSCYPRRAVVIATIIGILAPDFFLCSVEFRTDDLWAVFWLASIAMLVSAPVTIRRAAIAGVALGLAAAVSAKTSLLASVLAIAAVVAIALTREASLTLRGVMKRALVLAGAASIPPAIIAAYFAGRGAWRPFLYCTITHNLVSTEDPRLLLLLPLFLVLLVLLTRRLNRDEKIPPEVRRRRIFLFVAAYGYAAALISIWPIIETEHWLPFYPLAGIAVIGLLPEKRFVARLATATVAIELVCIIRISAPWLDQVQSAKMLIEQTTRLTTPDESVIDLKGEMLYRRRAFYYVLEKITKRAIAKGQLPDTIADDVLRTHTMVAVRDHYGFPRDGRAFLLRNFVRVGCLRVAGMKVVEAGAFQIEIPAEYSIVAANDEFDGMLDGTRYAAPRFLTKGTHRLTPSTPIPIAVLWTRAASLGFSPFVTDPRCG